jgi:hypothetical protein
MEKIEEESFSEEYIEKFFKKTFSIYESGYIDVAKFKFVNAVNNLKIDPSYIYEKYDKYHKVCLLQQNGKYTPKEFRLKSLSDFLEARMYNQEFSAIGKNNPGRDNYLYGI